MLEVSYSFLIMEYNNFIKHVMVQNNISLIFHKKKVIRMSP
jgi:hypothetical protein